MEEVRFIYNYDEFPEPLCESMREVEDKWDIYQRTKHRYDLINYNEAIYQVNLDLKKMSTEYHLSKDKIEELRSYYKGLYR